MDDKHTHNVDLFGLKKDAEPPAEAEAPRAGPGRPKLWGFLLVVDSILVIVFGGALAAQLYQHLWAAPAPVVAPGRRAPKPVPPPPLPAEAAKPAEAPAPAPAANVPSGSGERQPSRDGGPLAAGPKAAKPSLLAEPPRGREAAKPQAPGAKPAPAAAAPAPAVEGRRSMPVEFKIKAPKARKVQLAGAFIVRGGRKDMAEGDGGQWTLTLYLLPGNNYRYWFLVDGRKALDPENSQVERGASVLALP